MRKAVWLGVAVALACLAVFLGTHRGRSGPALGRQSPPSSRAAPPSLSVEVVEAKPAFYEEALEVTGTVYPKQEVDVAAEVGGKVVRVYAKEGDLVYRGQPLVLLKRTQFVAATKQAEAGLDLAKARLKQADVGLGIESVKARTSVAQAEAALKAAERNAEALRELYEQTKLQVEAQIESAKAALEAARQQLSLVEEGPRKEEIESARAAMEAAKAQVDQAQADLKRMRRLYEEGAVARRQFELAQLGYTTALKQYEMARKRYEALVKGARPQEREAARQQVRMAEAQYAAALSMRRAVEARKRQYEAALRQVEQLREALEMAKAAANSVKIRRADVAAAKAGVKQARAALTQALDALNSTVIRSPVTGVVAVRMVDPGEAVGQGHPVMRLLVLNPAKVEAEVSERDLTKVRKGAVCEVRVDALPGRVFWGRVTAINPMGRLPARRFVVEVEVPNPKLLLKSGMFARVRILVGAAVACVKVPAWVVKRGRVWVLGPDGRLHRRRVELAGRTLKEAYVKSGLKPGERVVVSWTGGEPREGARPIKVKIAR